jgi:hypothetical protein
VTGSIGTTAIASTFFAVGLGRADLARRHAGRGAELLDAHFHAVEPADAGDLDDGDDVDRFGLRVQQAADGQGAEDGEGDGGDAGCAWCTCCCFHGVSLSSSCWIVAPGGNWLNAALLRVVKKAGNR